MNLILIIILLIVGCTIIIGPTPFMGKCKKKKMMSDNELNKRLQALHILNDEFRNELQSNHLNDDQVKLVLNAMDTYNRLYPKKCISDNND